jgi:hypothetical protein
MIWVVQLHLSIVEYNYNEIESGSATIVMGKCGAALCFWAIFIHILS